LIKLHKVAGNIMSHLEAFDGSRAALDTDQILIVRGRSRKRIEPEQMGEELSKALSLMEAREIEMFSKEAADLIGLMDEQIRASVEIQGDTDVGGIERLKESLESMNFYVEYKLGLLERAGFFTIIYKDKSGVGPCFVEVVISHTRD
jgi:hypothetical protein